MPVRSLIVQRLPLCLLPLLAACAEPAQPPRAFATRLHAHTPSGEPVAGVRFWADGRALGASSASGELRAELAGREGAAVQLTAACPPAYRTPAPERRLVLRRVHAASGAPRSINLELSQSCEPLERTAALVVLATGAAGAGLPIRVDGELVGQTEPDGSAHVLLGAAPRASLRVELDTSALPQLRPRNPVHSFRLEDEDSILLLEQSFTAAPRPRRPAPAATRLPVAPRRPQRIQ